MTEQKPDQHEGSLLSRISEEELQGFSPHEVSTAVPFLDDEVDGAAVELYKQASDYVLASIRKGQQGKSPDITLGRDLASRMVDSLERDSALLLLATDRRQEFAVATHAVNVTILALRVAGTLKYTRDQQLRVGLAGLLHEIGVGWLPNRLLHEKGEVSPEIRRRVRERPVYSAEILERLCPDLPWLSKTVGQVYEREDGSGFPRGLKKEEILEEAKVLAIADVFEACIHDRPYRKALTGYQLLHELTRGQSGSFPPHIVKGLVRSFSVYPYNEYVVLSTNEIARVVEVNRDNVLRPVVDVLYNSKGERLSKPKTIDLSRHPSLSITEAVTYDTLPQQ